MKLPIVLITIPILMGIGVESAYGISMSNSQYGVEMSTVNSFAGKLMDPGSQLFSPSSRQQYTIHSGFSYITSIIPFTLSISHTKIDFGTLTPANPVSRTHTISISNTSAYGYNVFVFENHQLTNQGKAIIPNTTCDNGLCTDRTWAEWTSGLTYGFGFRCDNLIATTCDNGFSNLNYFRQFSDNSIGKTAQSFMSGTIAKNNQIQLTYKVNIPATQPAGAYSNTIYFIAVPKY